MESKIVTAAIIVFFGISISFSQTQKFDNMKPFKIKISQEKINALNSRIQNTRWFSESESTGSSPMFSIEYLKDIAAYWVDHFDWKKQEDYINSFHQFTTQVNDINMHFIYSKGKGSTKRIPLLLLHGWPGNFTDFLKVISLIRADHPNIEIIVPSIPGFAFSDTPEEMSSDNIAQYIHQLMSNTLGYNSYYIHGGDFGAFIGEKLAMMYPEYVKGLHLSDIPFYHLYTPLDDLCQAENEFIQKVNDWSIRDGAYAMIQGTKPKTLSVGLNDSPMALAAWLLQLFNDFGKKEEELFKRLNKDELLLNICIYWFSEKIYSSMRLYSEDMSGYVENQISKVTIPVGFSFNAFDISGIPPRAYAERFFKTITTWSEHTEVGHFPALSHPQLLKADLLQFIQKVETGK